jgi:di/tricarboxylate transporter
VNPREILAFVIIGGAVALFASGRFRYDLIALGALLVGAVTGLVPAKQVFSGFTSDVVVIIASALVVSAAVARSGLIETLVRPIAPRLRTPNSQVPAMAGATALLSMATKNVGALAILMPVALRVSRESKSSPSQLLMPMSFMSLLGGLVTLVGTSTNIIVSQLRQDTLGKPFAMFDFAPVGLVLTGLGLVFVSFAWRLLPKVRLGRSQLGEATAQAVYVTEARLEEGWPKELARLRDLDLDADSVRVSALIRDKRRRLAPGAASGLKIGDQLVLEGRQEALEAVFRRTPLVAAADSHQVEKDEAREEMRSIEAVVQSNSPLVGASAQRLRLEQDYGISLLAVSRSGQRITQRLRDIVLRAGDMLVLQAGEKALPGALQTLELLPLADRDLRLGAGRPKYLPAVILALAMTLVAFRIVPVAVGFFGAAVLVILTGGLSAREAYASLEAEVLILIGALTPLSEAVRATGGTDLIAGGLASGLHLVPPLMALGALMIASMACSPFLHNAPTVLVLGPIGVALAQRLHLNPDPFLMAVATGAGCDFLTPIGHQCNTLVMGPGGYRFGDYWKLGLPLSVLVILVGAPLISIVWHLSR